MRDVMGSVNLWHPPAADGTHGSHGEGFIPFDPMGTSVPLHWAVPVQGDSCIPSWP